MKPRVHVVAGIVVALNLGCGWASLDLVRHYEPQPGPLVTSSWRSPFYPLPTNRIRLQPSLLGVECTNTDYGVVSVGPVILGVPLPVIPILVGLFRNSAPWPRQILIQLDLVSDSGIPELRFDPRAVALRLPGGEVLAPNRITVGAPDTPAWHRSQGKVDELPVVEPIAIQIPHWASHVVSIYFPAAANQVEEFEVSIGPFVVNGEPVDSVTVRFRRSSGFRLVATVPVLD